MSGKTKHRFKSLWNTVRIRGPVPYILSFAGALVFVGLTVWAFQEVLANRAIHHAREDMKKGFAALAADRIDSYRRTLAQSEEGCRSMVGIYFEAHEAARLQWASEACMSNGHEIPEAFLGMAASKEMVGLDQDAVRILTGAASRFTESPDFHYRLALIFRRRQNIEGATAAYLEGTRRAPNNEQFALGALEFFSQVSDWPNARRMADNLKNAKTDSAEIKLLIAQALRRGGDPETARTLVEQARTLMASQAPEQQETLKKAYGELLSDGVRVPASIEPGTQPLKTQPSKRMKRR